MKTSHVTFSELRRLLLDLGFSESRPKGFWRFEHSASGAVLLFRPYTEEEDVSISDLGSARMHLDWRGLVSANAFDDSLTKRPA
jgi:hypothetical protein